MIAIVRLFYLSGLLGHVYCQNLEKRLLLNDPNVIHSQLTELQRQLQELTSKFNAQETKLQTQEATIKLQQTKLLAQEGKISELTVKQSATQKEGATYVRWGKHGCPDNDTELVYSGFAGGSYFGHTGGAAEYVCLSPSPVLVTLHDSVHNATMYGAEYDSNAFGPDNGDDMPCAVCRSKSTSSVLMIPGTNVCVPGWRTQYKGYLAAGSFDQAAASQYICLDEIPETIVNGHVNNNGKLVHPVLAVCGSLECPPYKNNKYLTCVVCTK
ncbi:short-chain collagen C4-like [Saccostrea cucullata]|uniref:short-chain collagen C4-like n=1 Tax=Saccostrea cuccullata TaxID=36930 RepID=UPI002ED1E753